jgi:hypothetical protein
VGLAVDWVTAPQQTPKGYSLSKGWWRGRRGEDRVSAIATVRRQRHVGRVELRARAESGWVAGGTRPLDGHHAALILVGEHMAVRHGLPLDARGRGAAAAAAAPRIAVAVTDPTHEVGRVVEGGGEELRRELMDGRGKGMGKARSG